MRKERAVLGVFSCMHFLVDAACAFAMYGVFRGRDAWYWHIFLYDFCAFALQMPLGVVLDGICRGKSAVEKYRCSAGIAVLGAVLTLAGGFTHVIVLGIGNALFHVGGGAGTIWSSEEERSVCTRLGVFVAPGALGLFLGNVWSQSAVRGWIALAGALALLCFGGDAPVAGTRRRFWKLFWQIWREQVCIKRRNGGCLLFPGGGTEVLCGDGSCFSVEEYGFPRRCVYRGCGGRKSGGRISV